MLGVGNNGTADAGRNLALALALAVFGSTDVDVAAGFKQQVVLGDQTAAADGDIAFFGKQTGFTAHGQGAAADAADLARSLPLIVKSAEGGDMVAVVNGETAALAAAGLPAAVGRGQQSDEAVFEFGIGEAVPLSEQDGFEHGQQGIGGTAAVVSKVTGSLTIQVLFDRLPINHLIQL